MLAHTGRVRCNSARESETADKNWRRGTMNSPSLVLNSLNRDLFIRNVNRDHSVSAKLRTALNSESRRKLIAQ